MVLPTLGFTPAGCEACPAFPRVAPESFTTLPVCWATLLVLRSAARKSAPVSVGSVTIFMKSNFSGSAELSCKSWMQPEPQASIREPEEIEVPKAELLARRSLPRAAIAALIAIMPHCSPCAPAFGDIATALMPVIAIK